MSLAKELKNREEKLHVLINNAGVTWGEPLEKFSEIGWDKVFSVNVKSPFHLTVGLLPLLRNAATREDPSRVINIGSINGFMISPVENYSYTASKAAVHQLTRHLASRLAPDNITVNAIACGLFPSKMGDQLPKEVLIATTPLRREGTPPDIGGTCIYLSSRAGSFVTGSIHSLDGGVSILSSRL
eukprot:TRINITY_DN943_c0_g2_i3.p2 TRINITY_DN943_c0_g2~~TRINITY_DN943_c0_g2_i3.p2  ORF type:complete len:185 (+),score=39.46 TRINITY_DN943_c0_g2_i3:658-1212(+)